MRFLYLMIFIVLASFATADFGIQEEINEQLNNATICGNNVCQAGENSLTCPLDCPAEKLSDDNYMFKYGGYVLLGIGLYALYRRSKR